MSIKEIININPNIQLVISAADLKEAYKNLFVKGLKESVNDNIPR